MTKDDILHMKSSAEINHTIFTNPELWDEEIKEYSIKVAKKEKIEMYGSEYFLPTPLKCKADK